ASLTARQLDVRSDRACMPRTFIPGNHYTLAPAEKCSFPSFAPSLRTILGDSVGLGWQDLPLTASTLGRPLKRFCQLANLGDKQSDSRTEDPVPQHEDGDGVPTPHGAGCGHCPASIFAAAITACVRLSTPSFSRISETCAFTVASETERLWAICLLRSP